MHWVIGCWAQSQYRHGARVVFLLAMISSGPKAIEREVCLSWLCLFYFWPSGQDGTIRFLSLGKGRWVPVDDDSQNHCLFAARVAGKLYISPQEKQSPSVEVCYIRDENQNLVHQKTVFYITLASSVKKWQHCNKCELMFFLWVCCLIIKIKQVSFISVVVKILQSNYMFTDAFRMMCGKMALTDITEDLYVVYSFVFE